MHVRGYFVGSIGLVACLGAISCGGGGASEGSPSPFFLVDFSVESLDNVAINRPLEFTFSAAVDPASIAPASIQIRKGAAFGQTVRGQFEVAGAVVRFYPDLPGLCDFSDAGLQPDTTYRVTVVGYPEAFAVRSLKGKPLDASTSHEFSTPSEDSPDLFVDTAPGVPSVLSSVPSDGTAAVEVVAGNEVIVTFSESLLPCSVNPSTVVLSMTEVGDPNVFNATGSGRASGFSPVEDQDPDPFRWGAANSTSITPPQALPIDLRLEQDYAATRVRVSLLGGASFPDDALLVLELRTGIADFGGNFLAPETLAFTTENLPPRSGAYVLDFAGETPIVEGETTADVNTSRSPGRAQGFFVLPGDGDNGTDLLSPSHPAPCYGQVNDGTQDDFDPSASVTLHSGMAVNTCPNEIDGSKAVVFEYRTFRIRSGITVTIDGVNPVIILVSGSALIEAGGTLILKGKDGTRWQWTGQGASSPVTSPGGAGVAGGGAGGSSIWGDTSYGQDGVDGFGSPDALTKGGVGSGKGGVAITKVVSTNGGTAGGGGGGGHGNNGSDGGTLSNPNADFKAAVKSQGGSEYRADSSGQRMLQPSAGAGGGGGGYLDPTWAGGASNAMSGGGGGGGGGFVDITSSHDIVIGGTIDARGGKGGNNVGLWNGAQYLCNSGSGGGGAGGGIRLLSGTKVDVLASAVLTTAAGAGGGTDSNVQPVPDNRGGNGADGRIVLEDADGIMGTAAAFVPSYDKSEHWRAPLDVSRFPGSLSARALTAPFWAGSIAPQFVAPLAADFLAGIPAVAGRGLGKTSMLIEARGFPMLRTGAADLTSPTPWRTVGAFVDSGVPDAPTFVSATPTDVTVPADNAMGSLLDLNAAGSPSAFLQVRVTFYLPAGMDLADFGPFLDRWVIRYTDDR